MTVTYTINHAISPELETWLAGQPDFVSIDIQPTSANVYYDHASVEEELAFKDLLAKQIGLSGENVNTSDTNILTNLSISPTALTADTDDWNPTGLAGASAIRVDATSAWHITGLAGGADGRFITIINISTFSVSIDAENSASTAANRFEFPSTYGFIDLIQNESVTFRYDGIDSRWKPINNAIGTGAIVPDDISPEEFFFSSIRLINSIDDTITSNQNDYDPLGLLSSRTFARITTDASRNITGLATGVRGRIVVVQNVGSFNIVLKNNDAASAEANRFLFTADITLTPNQTIALVYDENSTRWRPFSTY